MRASQAGATRSLTLSSEAVCEMASWGHNSGFSVDASVRIGAKDCAGLERLARYCARPVFASERLSWAREGERLRYRLPKPRADGQNMLELTPFELLDRLAVLDCMDELEQRRSSCRHPAATQAPPSL